MRYLHFCLWCACACDFQELQSDGTYSVSIYTISKRLVQHCDKQGMFLFTKYKEVVIVISLFNLLIPFMGSSGRLDTSTWGILFYFSSSVVNAVFYTQVVVFMVTILFDACRLVSPLSVLVCCCTHIVRCPPINCSQIGLRNVAVCSSAQYHTYCIVRLQADQYIPSSVGLGSH